MKQIYVVYNSFSEKYIFSEGSTPYSNERRVSFGEEEISKKLKSLVDPKRKSLLTLIDVEDSLAKKVEALFENSKISIARQNRE